MYGFENLDNDIALLELDGSASMTDYVNTVSVVCVNSVKFLLNETEIESYVYVTEILSCLNAKLNNKNVYLKGETFVGEK